MWEPEMNRIRTAELEAEQKEYRLENKWEWGKREILLVVGVALFFVGVGTAIWISNVGIAMWLVGLLLLGVAVNERLISWPAVALLGLYLTVTAIALLIFVMMHAADFGINWLDHISWFFRVVGVTVSLPMLGLLWFIVGERRQVYIKLRSESPPSDLPAAAVSELVDRDERPRTPFTIVLEMLQKGALEITSAGGRPQRYLLTARPGCKFKWEQTLVDSLPQEPMYQFSLLERLNEPELGLRQQIHEYLRRRGLLHHESAAKSGNIWFAALAVLGSVLMSVGLALWIARLGPAWPVGVAMIGAAYVAAAWVGYRQIEKLSHITAAGRLEIRQWRGFGAHIESPDFGEEQVASFGSLDSLMAYSVALNRTLLWRPEPKVYEEPRSDMAAAIAESWRRDKSATLAGFATGAYMGSLITPGEGIVERIFDLSDFSATFGAFDAFGGGGDSGDLGGGGEFGGGGDFGGGGGDFGL